LAGRRWPAGAQTAVFLCRSGRPELLEIHPADAVHELAVAPLALHHLDRLLLALADDLHLHRDGVVEAQHPHHLGVDPAHQDDFVLRVADHFDVGVAGALVVAPQELAGLPPRDAGPRLVEERLDLLDLIVILVVLGLGIRALELVAGAIAVDHHRLDAGTERVILLAEPIELAQIVGRLDDALVTRRADVELLVLVFGFERVGLDRPERGLATIRPQVLLNLRCA